MNHNFQQSLKVWKNNLPVSLKNTKNFNCIIMNFWKSLKILRNKRAKWFQQRKSNTELLHLTGNKLKEMWSQSTWKVVLCTLLGRLPKSKTFYLTEHQKILILEDQYFLALFKTVHQNKVTIIQTKRLSNWLKNFHKLSYYFKISRK